MAGSPGIVPQFEGVRCAAYPGKKRLSTSSRINRHVDIGFRVASTRVSVALSQSTEIDVGGASDAGEIVAETEEECAGTRASANNYNF